jgi:hypothetical protein
LNYSTTLFPLFDYSDVSVFIHFATVNLEIKMSIYQFAYK